MNDVVFKLATEPWEFDAIHALNYRTFVEEIPQHPENDTHRQVDRFHEDNIYCIGVHDGHLLGMVSLRTKRPFSLDQKLTNIEQYLPLGKNICEIRLLAVEPSQRHSRFTLSLFQSLARYAIQAGFDLGIMSGTTRQLKLYQRIGFVPFGPLVGKGDALFQPMALSLDSFVDVTLKRLKMPMNRIVNFLPGPVAIHADTQAAMSAHPYSHRSDRFKRCLVDAKAALCKLTCATQVEILVGPGTLANDMVAAQLSLLNETGLMASNGEFGERLLDHATRMQLTFETMVTPWGCAIDVAKLEAKLASDTAIQWLWLTHCETSTGSLVDLPTLSAICRKYAVKLCVDCISTVGVLPVDLSDVYLATTVSGKALAAYPGLSIVFHHHAIAPAPSRLPRYLDLGLYASRKDGDVPFTHSSNLVEALSCALAREDWAIKFARVKRNGAILRQEFLRRGYDVVGNAATTSPAVLTIALPATMASIAVGSELEKRGFLLSYQSQYLQRHNWLQICLMGAKIGTNAPNDADIINVIHAIDSVVMRSAINK